MEISPLPVGEQRPAITNLLPEDSDRRPRPRARKHPPFGGQKQTSAVNATAPEERESQRRPLTASSLNEAFLSKLHRNEAARAADWARHRTARTSVLWVAKLSRSSPPVHTGRVVDACRQASTPRLGAAPTPATAPANGREGMSRMQGVMAARLAAIAYEAVSRKIDLALVRRSAVTPRSTCHGGSCVQLHSRARPGSIGEFLQVFACVLLADRRHRPAQGLRSKASRQ